MQIISYSSIREPVIFVNGIEMIDSQYIYIL